MMSVTAGLKYYHTDIKMVVTNMKKKLCSYMKYITQC